MKRMQRLDRKPWMAATGALALVLPLLIAACGGGESRNRSAVRGGGEDGAKSGGSGGGGGAATAGLKKIDPANSGTISGVVKFDGTPPPPQKIDMSGNPECMAVVKEEAHKEDVVVHDGKVEFAFLCLDVKDEYELPAEKAELDQEGCRYTPHVIGIQAKQTLIIKSSDNFAHNVHYLGKERDGSVVEDNFGMNKPSSRERTFAAEDGMLKVFCNIHPWMGAWVGIKTHPFFAVSGVDGGYTIKNVPPGEYDLMLHHEKLGDQKVHVKVETGKTTTQDFTLKM